MNRQNRKKVYIALLHHPVLGRKGEVIGSAVTNLDLHDIARTARTYGVEQYFIITPYSDQQELVAEIIDHWQNGHGATYNPARKEAFTLVRLADSLEYAIEELNQKNGVTPLIVSTSAKFQDRLVSYKDSRKRIGDGEPTLLVFGTAHGLAPEITQMADYTLPPIDGCSDYNHLSVRSAVAIICDRLLGEWN